MESKMRCRICDTAIDIYDFEHSEKCEKCQKRGPEEIKVKWGFTLTMLFTILGFIFWPQIYSIFMAFINWTR
jgi:hypothetical protein